MPSYSQYKRQMATMDADDANIETWITVKGNHIPIMKGQSKEEAVQSFLEKKGKSSGGAKTVMKPDIEKPGSTTVVSKGSGKAKYKVGDVTKQGKIKEVIPARLSDTPYYKLENGKTYLEEELHAEKPAKTPKTAGQLKKAASNLESDPAYHYERADRLSEMIKQREKELENPNISRAMKNTIERGIGELQLAISKHWDAAGKLEKAAREKAKPANKGWQNARSGHPETIGKVVRRVVKKMGEERKPDVSSEPAYNKDVARKELNEIVEPWKAGKMSDEKYFEKYKAWTAKYGKLFDLV